MFALIIISSFAESVFPFPPTPWFAVFTRTLAGVVVVVIVASSLLLPVPGPVPVPVLLPPLQLPPLLLLVLFLLLLPLFVVVVAVAAPPPFTTVAGATAAAAAAAGCWGDGGGGGGRWAGCCGGCVNVCTHYLFLFCTIRISFPPNPLVCSIYQNTCWDGYGCDSGGITTVTYAGAGAAVAAAATAAAAVPLAAATVCCGGGGGGLPPHLNICNLYFFLCFIESAFFSPQHPAFQYLPEHLPVWLRF